MSELRKRFVVIRITPSERTALRAAARKAKADSVGDYIRSKVTGLRMRRAHRTPRKANASAE